MTPEYQAIRDNRPILIQGMVNDAHKVSGDLLASGMITSANHTELMNTVLDDNQKVEKLMIFIENRIKFDHTLFTTFVNVLKKKEWYYGKALVVLQASVSKYKLNQTPPALPTDPSTSQYYTMSNEPGPSHSGFSLNQPGPSGLSKQPGPSGSLGPGTSQSPSGLSNQHGSSSPGTSQSLSNQPGSSSSGSSGPGPSQSLSRLPNQPGPFGLSNQPDQGPGSSPELSTQPGPSLEPGPQFGVHLRQSRVQFTNLHVHGHVHFGESVERLVGDRPFYSISMLFLVVFVIAFAATLGVFVGKEVAMVLSFAVGMIICYLC